MKCPNCKTNLPAEAAFCLRCGSSLSPMPGGSVTPSGAFPAPPWPQKRSNRKAGAVAAAVGAIAVFAVAAAALHAARGRDSTRLAAAGGAAGGGNLVQAPAVNSPANLVQAAGSSQPAPLASTAQTGPPANVVDYLKFLKGVERRKEALIRKETGDALLMLDNVKALSGSIDDSTYNKTFQGVSGNTTSMADDWNSLTQYFNSVPPPVACQQLHDRYYDHLGKIQGMMAEVQDALGKVGSNAPDAIHELSNMQGKASADADTAIQKADDALAAVCSEYQIPKDFSVRGDGGASSILQ
ncbi:MAG: zinc ribbon domain-containing protein [Armatimonadetes bacterium]|nr:zinc ribbon domain-containing protein [Armatimonadota bacterium]MDE2207685.1 zinc ribbon domain-containing protein [Armatimonadota bacterium]